MFDKYIYKIYNLIIRKGLGGNMAFNSNGQVQYLILDSLADGSKYGLEIIEFIAKNSNGVYILK